MAVSSAYWAIIIVFFVGWGMSWVNMLYSIGARTEPCGTPARILRQEECVLLYFTLNLRSVRNDLSMVIIGGEKPARNILNRRPSCQTRSKAFETSKNTAPVTFLRVKPSRICSVTVVI